jgi:DNA-binding GntR family transcriptional regulator
MQKLNDPSNPDKSRPKEPILLAAQAYSSLKSLLISGELKAGQFISISELVAITQLPLAPVREAVKHAESLGFMKIIPKKGLEVMQASPVLIKECFHLRSIFDQEGARELIEDSKPNRNKLDTLRKKHLQILKAAQKGINADLQNKAMAIDWEMHSLLGGSINNSEAQKTYEHNKDCLWIIQRSRPPLPDRIIPAMLEHLEIIDALIGGNADKSTKLIRKHFLQTLRWWGIV